MPREASQPGEMEMPAADPHYYHHYYYYYYYYYYCHHRYYYYGATGKSEGEFA